MRDKVIDLLDTECELVLRIRHDIGLDFHSLDCVFHDVKAIVQLIKHREEYFLENLHITEIPGREIPYDETDVVRQTRYLVAAGPDQLEHIRILLVRHDAGTCCQGIRQLDKTEILAGIHASVESQSPNGLSD